MKVTIPRSDYMDGKFTHRQYYDQFVDDRVLALVARVIPLRKWDAMVRSLPHSVVERLKLAGDYLTLCTGGCTLKETARQIVEAQCTSSASV